MSRTENILSQKFFEVFLKTTFLHVSCYPVHCFAENIFFGFSKSSEKSFDFLGFELKCDEKYAFQDFKNTFKK